MLNHKFRLFGSTVELNPLKIILAVAIFLRIPSLFEPYWYGDEAIYLAVGEGLRQGELLYRDIFDHKPPAIYLLAAFSGSLFWFKFIMLVWHTATLIFFYKLTKVILQESQVPKKQHEKASIIATVIFMLLTTLPLLEGNIVNAELLMAGPTILALYLLFSKNLTTKNIFLSGVLFSVAILFKVPAAFDLFAIIAYWGILSVWKFKEISQAIVKSIILFIGVLVPILLSIVYFWYKGALSYYLSAAFSDNLSYIGRWSVPTISSNTSGQFEGNLIFRAEVLIVILIAILLFKKFLDRATLFISIWFSFALFALLLSGRPYPHYLIQIIAPLAILLTLLNSNRDKYRFFAIPFLFIFLGALVFYQFSYYPVYSYYKNFISFVVGTKTSDQYISSFDSRMPRTYKLAQELAERTQPKDHIFIWGTEPELYALSRHVPPGRYVTSFHISDFEGKQETIDALRNNPPKYILIIHSEQRNLPGLDKLLSERYLYLKTVEDIDVWKLIPDKLADALRK